MGYQALEASESGLRMLTPTFLKVSESNKVSLAELKVTGYEPPQWTGSGKSAHNEGGCTGGKFVVQLLNTQGIAEKDYYWIEYYKNATTKVGPGWFADPSATPIEGGEGSVELDAGKALWIQGSGLSLQPTGALNPFDIEVKTADSGLVPVGNCTPVDLTLNDLTVTGYAPPQWTGSGKSAHNEGGCTGGKFVVQLLDTQGVAERDYYWIEYYKNATTKVGPGWFADPSASPIEGGADKVEIPAGKGLWIQGSGLKLVIPAPEL